jgi:nucleotide-binding universal stress UspA family protein
MFQKILVAVDRTDMGKQVFDEALDLAQKLDTALMLVHVLSPMDEGYPMPVFPGADSVYPVSDQAIRVYADQWQEFEKHGLTMLQAMSDQAEAAKIMCEFSQHVGDPGKVICMIAKDWGADLIVMGRRGRTGLSEMILGSASNYVLHHAPCSVMALQGTILAQ